MDREQFVQIFEDMGGDAYDKNNAFFKPLHDNLSLLNILILKKLPVDANILCVGVGTGADILELAAENSKWNFVGIDPAQSMLKKCREKIRDKELENRCELFHGFLSDYESEKKFDAVLCLFVMHFVKNIDERAQMYSQISGLLSKGGYLINTEISVDTESYEYSQLIENWKETHALTGASDEKLSNIPNVIEKQLGVLAPKDTEKLISDSGFQYPIQYFQSFLIRGWYSIKKI